VAALQHGIPHEVPLFAWQALQELAIVPVAGVAKP